MSTPNDRIKVRWRKGWAAIPNAVLRDKRLSRNARLLWCVLVSYAGNDETAWPSQEQLAQDCAEDDTPPTLRSIQRWIKELEDADWLTRTRTRYGNDYELHEPASDTSVASDPTSVSHQTRHQSRMAPDTDVASDPTPGSRPLKNKTHAPRLNHQDSSPSAAGAAGDDDGAAGAADPATVAWLKSVGVKTPAALRDLGALELAHLRQQWEEFRAENTRRGRPLAVGAFVALMRANPTPAAAVPPAPPTDAAPADDARRPDWISAADWQSLTSVQREVYAGAELTSDGRIVPAFPDLQAQVNDRFRATTERLIQAYAPRSHV